MDKFEKKDNQYAMIQTIIVLIIILAANYTHLSGWICNSIIIIALIVLMIISHNRGVLLSVNALYEKGQLLTDEMIKDNEKMLDTQSGIIEDYENRLSKLEVSYKEACRQRKSLENRLECF